MAEEMSAPYNLKKEEMQLSGRKKHSQLLEER
jgi:hypothetical protein